MPQFLVAGYLPDDFDPSQMDEAAGLRIHELNKDMIAAGVRKFACGLGQAKSLRSQTDGEVLITDGPYLETKEHIGGFWILECADMDDAMSWARKAVAATRGQGEVREIFFMPAPEEN
ncbi:DGPFAETKE domain protein [Candidatus Koribacter versatilis Ellin345]|uniref:DGPFAETKE domain protein n=1 Tax=Koribacter versatilis (strain Ellin345) TaxID=204669 RepID=Q1IM27_KORVE|nr:YciI family protein [Candidatus Koribacter versatilis]ABF42073.1 DGPFAETKE domain protein [Candidatus Koribacter versatilis Ellin345]